MPRYRRKGPPKHLEKMLFINHKEDLMLDDRLHDLTLQSRLKLMELDRERSKVRNELRNSRKKQITISEAISSGLVPPQDAFFLTGGKGADMNHPNVSAGDSFGGKMSSGQSEAVGGIRRASAPPRRHDSLSKPQPVPRSTTFVHPMRTQSRMTINNQFSRHPAIPEHEEFESGKSEKRKHMILREDSVGNYVLGEFEKISQVVPDILRALAKKKEKQQEADEQARLKELRTDIAVDLDNIMNYEPDMNKVRKTVRAVKKLRHRMAISKRLENNKDRKSLDQMIKDKTENIGENDEYTDGTCALMKRRLEKKRRESSPFALDPAFMMRRQSVGGGSGDFPAISRRPSMAPEALMRRSSSTSALPTALGRSSTMISMGSGGRLNALGQDSEGEGSSRFIDEDMLVNRQRVMKEFTKYRTLQDRMDRFIVSTYPYRTNHRLEEMLQVK